MRHYRFILSLSLLCMFVSLAHAADHYVRAGATGANDGSDWTNAWTELPSQLVRGDTYYIADGVYDPYNFTTPVSGGTYIYIKKATDTDHGTNTGWSGSYGDGEAVFESDEDIPLKFSTSFIDMDGQVGSDGVGYGFRIHASDKVSYTVLVQDPTWSYSTLSNINLRHCDIHHRGAEVFIAEGEFTVAGSGDRIIVSDASRYANNNRIKLATTGTLPSGLVAGSGYDGQEYYVRNVDTQNNTIQLCDISDPYTPITGMNAGTGTHTFSLRKSSRGFQVHSMASLTNSVFSHCYIHDVPATLITFANDSHDNVFEHCILARNHSDSVSYAVGLQGRQDSGDDNVIRYCKFEDIEGGGIIMATDGWEIYGNLFTYTGNFPNPGQSGTYARAITAYGVNNLFYNNTIYGKIASGYHGLTLFYDSAGPNYVLNNIWANCGGRVSWQSGVVYDYNVYYDMHDAWAANYLANLATNEPNSVEVTTDPFEDASAQNFHLIAGLPYGLELNAPYDEDMAGNPRGADDAWDVGAYEYVDNSGELHYVRAGATGNNDGSDWTNAWTELPSTLVRGDTYYIADGAYDPYNFDTPVDGELYVYVKKATVANHGTNVGWDDSYGDGEALFESDEEIPFTISAGFFDMDGQVGSGETGYGFRMHALDKVWYSVLVMDPTWSDSLMSNIKVRYCNIHHRGAEVFIPEGQFIVAGGGDRIVVPDASRFRTNGYDRVKLATTGTLPSGLVAGSGYNGQEYYVRNIDTQNNTVQLYDVSNTASPITGMDAGTGTHTLSLRKAGRGFQVHSLATLVNSLISHCYIHDVPGISINLTGEAANNVIEHCLVARNHSDPVDHGEAIQTANGITDDNVVRYCTFENIEGTGVIIACNNWEIYGNVIFWTEDYPTAGQHGSYAPPVYCSTGVGNHYYNNTVYGKLDGVYSTIYFGNSTGPNYVKNNIWAHCASNMGWPAGVVFDNNAYYDMDSSYWTNYVTNYMATREPNSVVLQSDPFVDSDNYDFRLAVPLDYGVDMSAPYNMDMDGDTRGGDGGWDVGADEYVDE